MDNKPIDATYVTELDLHHDGTIFFKGGLCLSSLSLKDLKATRLNFLHPKEQDYFNTLQYPKRQYSYLLGRYCAKHALIAYESKICPTEICITNGVFQQPIVDSCMQGSPQVSISHTAGFGAALAFSEAHPMAIDIETIEPDKKDIILTQLTRHEEKLIHSISQDIPLQLLWTIKEALSKVLKCGLTVPFELLEVDSLAQHEDCFVSYFKNFAQYQAVSFLLPQAICSIVYPHKTKLRIGIAEIQERVHGFKLPPIDL